MKMIFVDFKSQWFRKPLLYLSELRGHWAQIYASWNIKARRFCSICTQMHAPSLICTLMVWEKHGKVSRRPSVDNCARRLATTGRSLRLSNEDFSYYSSTTFARFQSSLRPCVVTRR